MNLSDIDKKILNLLKKSPHSTYSIAKKLGISWGTATTHCYKLKALNLIDSKIEESKFGHGQKIVWWKKDEK